MSDEQQRALEIIGEKKRRLHLLQVQAARHGHDTPPHITIEIEDLVAEIAALQREADLAVSGMGVPAGLFTGSTAPSARPVAELAPPAAGSSAPPLPTELVSSASQHAAIAASPALVLDPPVLPSRLSPRGQTVSDLITALAGRTWAAVQGGASTGKTALAHLAAGRLGGVSWIDFKGLDDEAASFHLERACATLAGRPAPPQREPWYAAACAALGEGSVLVLDDLPDLAAAPLLRSRLLPLVRACAGSGIRLLSTSPHPLPPSVLEAVGDIVVEWPAPALTDDEAAEVLRAYGAPDDFVARNARLVNEFVRRHPFLLVAACQYLQRRNWALGETEIGDLLSGAHAADLGGEVYHKLRATVPDDGTRELLYRLTIPGRPFGNDHLEALAAVQERIARAAERVREVIHSWVEPLARGQWKVSPLLTRLAVEHLDTGTKRRCHHALGNLIVRQPMNQRQAFDAVFHLHQAGELGKAGTILMVILNEAFRVRASLEGEPILRLWTQEPLPAGMDLNLRLIIRGLHVALFHRMGRPLTFLVADLDALLQQADGSHRLGAAGAVSYAVIEAGRSLPSEANRWMRRFLTLPAPDGRATRRRRRDRSRQAGPPELSPSFLLHHLVWLLIAGLMTADHLRDWLDTVACLSAEQRREIFRGAHAHVASIVVADQLGATEQTKPAAQRDWPAVVVALDGLAARAKGLSLEGLGASFIRAKIITQAEFCKDVDGAQATATAALGAASTDPVVRFLIAGAMGRQHVLARRYADARFWLRLALQQDSSAVFPYERALVLLAASHAFGLENPQTGVEHARRAAALMEGSKDIPPIERARAYCELAVAEFSVEGAKAAFPSWDRAGEHLFAARTDSDAWKDLAVIFGHTSGYLAKVAETGEPPAVTRHGDNYAPPERGVFLTSNPARLAFFDRRNEGALWRVLGYYADAVGAEARAAAWKERAVALSKEHGLLPILLEAGRDDIPKILRESGFAEALAEGRKTGAGLVAFRREIEAQRDPSRPEFDVEVAVQALGEVDRRTAEDFGAIIGLVPAALSVALLAVGDRDQAAQKARDLVAACRAVAPVSSAPDLWELLADGVERAYVNGEANEAMLQWRRSLPKPTPASVEVLAMIAATADAAPEQAAATMLGVMPTLCGWYSPRTAVYREILLPFVDAYWTEAFGKRRFLFGNALSVECLLPGAKAAAEPERAAAILRAIHAGFKFNGPMPEDVRRWLFGSRSGNEQRARGPSNDSHR